MTIDKLKRVLQRARLIDARLDSHREGWLRIVSLKRAIMVECGTCQATFYNTRKSLIDLGWLRTHKRRFKLTDKDLTDEYDF